MCGEFECFFGIGATEGVAQFTSGAGVHVVFNGFQEFGKCTDEILSEGAFIFCLTTTKKERG